jgi:uncharacterized SAM-binding protein YcdF (DUF218 family)
MFFLVAKTLGAMAHAPLVFIEGLVLGVVLMWTRWRRAGRIVTTFFALVLAVAAVWPVGSYFARPLEDRFVRPELDAAPTGIIVLGGSVDEAISRQRGTPALNDAAERLTEAVALMRRYPEARLVFSGGSGRLRPAALTESDVVREIWTSLGVPADRVAYENTSRDTWENATNTKALVQPKPGERWLLVTSAMHMPRAVGIFRKIGFPVVAYPVDYQTGGVASDFYGIRQPAGEFFLLQSATHEWIGLVSYYLAGKSAELFPGP